MFKPNYFLILGLDSSADVNAINAAYEALAKKLSPTNFADNPNALEFASTILNKAREAQMALQDAQFREKHATEQAANPEPFAPEQLKPFLGHVCVAAGIISYPDLMDAISRQTDIDLPLGQILQERRLLSQTELEGMLMGLKLYGAPNRPLESIVKRLLAMGVVTLDMVKIALIDQRTTMSGLDEIFCKRGWLDPAVLAALK
jgi:hypothetical protein